WLLVSEPPPDLAATSGRRSALSSPLQGGGGGVRGANVVRGGSGEQRQPRNSLYLTTSSPSRSACARNSSISTSVPSTRARSAAKASRWLSSAARALVSGGCSRSSSAARKACISPSSPPPCPPVSASVGKSSRSTSAVR